MLCVLIGGDEDIVSWLLKLPCKVVRLSCAIDRLLCFVDKVHILRWMQCLVNSLKCEIVDYDSSA